MRPDALSQLDGTRFGILFDAALLGGVDTAALRASLNRTTQWGTRVHVLGTGARRRQLREEFPYASVHTYSGWRRVQSTRPPAAPTAPATVSLLHPRNAPFVPVPNDALVVVVPDEATDLLALTRQLEHYSHPERRSARRERRSYGWFGR